MKPDFTDPATRAELDQSLKRLDIHELEERLEVSPLLMAAGEVPVDPTRPSICCVCKIPNPFGPDGNLPYPTMDPVPLGPGISTGPTNPGLPI